MGFFQDLFSNDAAEDAAKAKIAGLNSGFSQAKGYLTEGTDKASGYYTDAIKRFDPYLERAYKGYDAYADATGANGAEGQARARAGFQTDPGYQFTIDQATQAVNRNQAAKGMLASGNTDTDLAKTVTGLADQQYGNYVSRLSPFLSQPIPAIQGQATIGTGQGNLFNQLGLNLGNLSYQTQSGIGDANASAELARTAAAKNTFDAIMGGINLAGKLIGMI